MIYALTLTTGSERNWLTSFGNMILNGVTIMLLYHVMIDLRAVNSALGVGTEHPLRTAAKAHRDRRR